MQKPIKKIVALMTLMSVTLFAGPVYANPFMQAAQSLMDANRRLASSQSELKFNLMTRIESEYQSGLAKSLAAKTDAIKSHASELDQVVRNLNDATSTISMDGLRNLALIRSQALDIARRSESIYDSSLSVVDSILLHRDFYKDFCSRFAPLVDASEIRANPFNVPIAGLIGYTDYYSRISGGEDGNQYDGPMVSGDPVVEGVAVFGLDVTVASSVGYALYQTLIVGKALTTSIGVGVAEGSIIATVGGVAAGIFIGGVVLVLVASVIWTEHRNNQRKEAAEKENQKIWEEYEAARVWYQSQRISQEEYQALARKHCESGSYARNVREQATKLEQSITSAEALGEKLKTSRAALAQIVARVESLYGAFKERLGAQYGQALVLRIEQEVATENRVKVLWDIYNSDIKRRIEAVNLAVNSSANCEENYLRIGELKVGVNSVISMLDAGGDLPRYKDELTEIKTRVAKVIELLASKVGSCANKFSGSDIVVLDI